MDKKKIDSLFLLMRKSKSTVRENLKTLYLDRLGEKIIPFCIKHYQEEKQANVRSDLVGFLIQYARKSPEVIDFAKRALNDPSKVVKRRVLPIFA